MRRLLLLSLLIGITLAKLDPKQIEAMKKLLKSNDVFPTCNLVLFKELLEYDDADQKCKNFDLGVAAKKRTEYQGNLATVNDDDKNQDLTLVLGMAYEEDLDDKWGPEQWVWSGLRKVRNLDPFPDDQVETASDVLKRKPYNPSDWEWADGSTPASTSYENWLKGQPDQKHGPEGTQYQMRINHAGGWDDTYKSKKHPYACDYQGKYILSATNMTWHDAKKACEDAGLIFAKVRSDAEALEMKAAAEKFIGPINPSLRRYASDNWIWIGGSDAEIEGSWIWVADGTPNKYAKKMKWQARKNGEFQPDHAARLKGKVQDYLAFSKWGTFDDSYDSEKRQRAFACQCPGT